MDLEYRLLTGLAAKTRSRSIQRLAGFWNFRFLAEKNEFVFYNHETGKPFVDLKPGLPWRAEAGIVGVTDMLHSRLSVIGSRRG